MQHEREPGASPGLVSEEATLQEVMRELTGTQDPKAALRRLAEAARAAAAAESARLDRIHPLLRETEVMAEAGGPAAFDSDEPDADRRRGRALVLQLTGRGELLGSLALLRSPDAPPFDESEAVRLGIFADLAALGLRLLHSREEASWRQEELERTIASRAGLIRDVSHDLKNPLGAADGYLGLLEDGLMGELGEKQREGIARARRSIRSALALVHDLDERAQAEAGHIELNPGPLELQEALVELVGSFRDRAKARRVELRTACPADLPVLVTDGQRVRQVLSNLLSNAIKYTPEGGMVSVEAFASRDAEGDTPLQVSVSVRDTGPGIPPERQQEIFRELSRLTAGEFPGAGLGLAISRRIARALGGDIHLESEPGRGACFTLSLPPRDLGS